MERIIRWAEHVGLVRRMEGHTWSNSYTQIVGYTQFWEAGSDSEIMRYGLECWFPRLHCVPFSQCPCNKCLHSAINKGEDCHHVDHRA